MMFKYQFVRIVPDRDKPTIVIEGNIVAINLDTALVQAQSLIARFKPRPTDPEPNTAIIFDAASGREVWRRSFDGSEVSGRKDGDPTH
jgi:hypothetical protein